MRGFWPGVVVMCALAGGAPMSGGQAEPEANRSVSTARDSIPVRSNPAATPRAAVPEHREPVNKAGASAGAEGDGEQQGYPAPQIRVINPPPLPAPWTMHERIGWGATVGLAVVGYLGVLAGLRLLHQTRAQVQTLAELAQAALEAANASALNAQAVIAAQRPWIRMSIERSREGSNTLQIMATNHGRTPAEIVDCPDKIALVKDEGCLLPDLWAEVGRSGVLKSPILLLPGEATVVQRFARGDARWVCKTEEALAGVRRCEESIFVFGRVVYRDLEGRDATRQHNTDWCFRYVHGESISDLVMDGPFGYNRHT